MHLKPEINDIMSTFYKCKQQYESKIEAKKIQILKNNSISSKQRHEEVLNLVIPCIKCNARVGNTFEIKYNNNEDVREFYACCGTNNDAVCKFKIHFKVHSRKYADTLIVTLREKLNKFKEQLIIEKNNIMFFNDLNKEEKDEEVLKIIKEIEKYSYMYNYVIEQQNLLIDNYEIKKQLLIENDNLGEEVSQFKAYISKYVRSGVVTDLTEASKYLANDMTNTLNKIRNLKYKVNEVLYKADNYFLIQSRYTLDDKIITYNEGDMIIENSEKSNLKDVKVRKNTTEEVQRNTTEEVQIPPLITEENVTKQKTIRRKTLGGIKSNIKHKTIKKRVF